MVVPVGGWGSKKMLSGSQCSHDSSCGLVKLCRPRRGGVRRHFFHRTRETPCGCQSSDHRVSDAPRQHCTESCTACLQLARRGVAAMSHQKQKSSFGSASGEMRAQLVVESRRPRFWHVCGDVRRRSRADASVENCDHMHTHVPGPPGNPLESFDIFALGHFFVKLRFMRDNYRVDLHV